MHLTLSRSAYKGLVTQYVFFPIDTKKQTTRRDAWRQTHPSTNNQEPLVQVFSPEGKVLHDKKGISKTQLINYIKASGRPISVKQAKYAKKSLKKAKELYSEGEVEQAVLKIASMVKSGSKAAIAIKLDTFAKKLTEEATQSIKEAEVKLKDDSESAQGALELLQTYQKFKKMPGYGKPLKKHMSVLRRSAKIKLAFAQASTYNRGLREMNNKKYSKAKAIFEKLLKRYPKTEFANSLKEKIAEMSEESPATTAQK